MEKVARTFKSHAEAERADLAYYRSLTPQQRLDLLLEMVSQAISHEPEQGFARVCRIIKLHES